MVGHIQTELCLALDPGAWMDKPQTRVFAVVSIPLREKEQGN